MIPLWYGAKWFQYSTRQGRRLARREETRTPARAANNPLLIITHLTPATG